MKTSVKYIVVIFIGLLVGCTEIDNYDGPDSGIQGNLIDKGTGENLEVKSPGGGSIRLLQQDPAYPNPVPIDLEFMADGKYKNTSLFSATYKAIPRDGGFVYAGDTLTVDARAGEIAELDFEVYPYYRITASVSGTTITYTVKKGEMTGSEKLQEIIFMMNDYPTVNESISSNATGYYVNLWKQDVSGIPDDEIIGRQQTFTIDWSATHLPRGTYYFRVGARSSAIAKYNYSPVIEGIVE